MMTISRAGDDDVTSDKQPQPQHPVIINHQCGSSSIIIISGRLINDVDM
jgi:hypothetical protein